MSRRSSIWGKRIDEVFQFFCSIWDSFVCYVVLKTFYSLIFITNHFDCKNLQKLGLPNKEFFHFSLHPFEIDLNIAERYKTIIIKRQKLFALPTRQDSSLFVRLFSGGLISPAIKNRFRRKKKYSLRTRNEGLSIAWEQSNTFFRQIA